MAFKTDNSEKLARLQDYGEGSYITYDSRLLIKSHKVVTVFTC